MNYDFSKTVWQTTECACCGGCCYAASVDEKGVIMKDGNCQCERLKIDPNSGLASCLSHDNCKPNPCRNYDCRNAGLTERIYFARAVMVLGTRPVLNFREIMRFLEDYKMLDL